MSNFDYTYIPEAVGIYVPCRGEKDNKWRAPWQKNIWKRRFDRQYQIQFKDAVDDMRGRAWQDDPDLSIIITILAGECAGGIPGVAGDPIDPPMSPFDVRQDPMLMASVLRHKIYNLLNDKDVDGIQSFVEHDLSDEFKARAMAAMPTSWKELTDFPPKRPPKRSPPPPPPSASPAPSIPDLPPAPPSAPAAPAVKRTMKSMFGR